MSLITHKYTPAQMSDRELEATFAARGHTVDYLLQSLRDQSRSGTLSSFVVTGPRGAGKSTVIHMVALRIRQDPELSRAWVPVAFPEEQFDVASLRDFLAAILRALPSDILPAAAAWAGRVEAEASDEQSEQLAVTGLREITQQAGKRLVVFVENLNLMLEECLDDQMKGTLRRLLMVEPFMMLIGSAVHDFSSLRNYDEAFFNYFGPVPLDRLSAEQVFELLKRRAAFDGNERFLRDFPHQQAKIRAIVHLSGGNPRLILMLYELLSQRQVTTIVQYLRRLVDELTPLLKDEMENLPPQQRKIVHALMERGGTAQPTDLVGPTRLPLNAITTQLKRLREAQIVEVLGGGKGRAANYTVPDKLFSIWYQMRYLGKNRRRIELFVEVLRVWFEAEERFATVKALASRTNPTSENALRDAALTTEYFAASLLDIRHATAARDIAVQQWLRVGDRQEAAFACAEFAGLTDGDRPSSESAACLYLGRWCTEHSDLKTAMEILTPIASDLSKRTIERAEALFQRGCCQTMLGNSTGALADFTAVVELPGTPQSNVAAALYNRGVAKYSLGDTQGAAADFSALIAQEGAPRELKTQALFNRAMAKHELGDAHAALSDYSAVMMAEGASEALVTTAQVNRGVIRGLQGDTQGALTDYDAAVARGGAPNEVIAQALFNRGAAKVILGDARAGLTDYTAVITMEGASEQLVATVLVNRGVTKRSLGDVQGALSDFTEVVALKGVPDGVLGAALANRGVAHHMQGHRTEAIADWKAALESETSNDEAIDISVTGLFRLHWEDGAKEEAAKVLDQQPQRLAALAPEARVLALARLLSRLASPETRQSWPYAVRRLLATQPPEVVQALAFFEAASAVLEGGEKSVLDPLPPEQRELALRVLKRLGADRPVQY